jgi:hypothetical protein
VGIAPAREHTLRPRLWAALEAAYPVSFAGRAPGALRDLDALVAIGAAPEFLGLPCLHSTYIPDELEAGEALRERLRPGRKRALLALARFLADLTAHLRPAAPPLHAAFVIDDPNLRRRRYGHIDYAELLESARAHGYHVAIAMVPLDGRLARRDGAAARIFRAGREHLSLCVHGNDHDGPELGRPTRDAEALALVAQALRRTGAFERRTGLAVDRVMVPPHERLSEPVARALRAYGFAGVCTTRPYPWVANTPEHHWLARPPEAGPLAAWGPVDLVAGGLPVLLRAELAAFAESRSSREDLALRAFLGQPLILYGHHDLLAEGPDALARAAAEIDRLGDVRWSSLGTIARALAPAQPASNLSALAPAQPAANPSALNAGTMPRRRLSPRLRRLASEGRDRLQAVSTPPLKPGRDRAAARGGTPRSWSART